MLEVSLNDILYFLDSIFKVIYFISDLFEDYSKLTSYMILKPSKTKVFCRLSLSSKIYDFD